MSNNLAPRLYCYNICADLARLRCMRHLLAESRYPMLCYLDAWSTLHVATFIPTSTNHVAPKYPTPAWPILLTQNVRTYTTQQRIPLIRTTHANTDATQEQRTHIHIFQHLHSNWKTKQQPGPKNVSNVSYYITAGPPTANPRRPHCPPSTCRSAARPPRPPRACSHRAPACTRTARPPPPTPALQTFVTFQSHAC